MWNYLSEATTKKPQGGLDTAAWTSPGHPPLAMGRVLAAESRIRFLCSCIPFQTRQLIFVLESVVRVPEEHPIHPIHTFLLGDSSLFETCTAASQCKITAALSLHGVA